MTKKKCHLKNDKVEHVLQNHTQIFSPWKKKLIRTNVLKQNEWEQLLLYLYLCILEEKKT